MLIEENKQLQVRIKDLEVKLEKAIRIMKGLWLDDWADRETVMQLLYLLDPKPKPVDPELMNKTKEINGKGI